MATNALIIIDMLNDFVDGKLGNPHAHTITPNIQQLLQHARQSQDWAIVYANDLHDPNDREISIWGEHAMRNSTGAQVINALEPNPNNQEWEEPKHFYSAFDETPLAEKLNNLGVRSVYLTGQHTSCCVRHTAYSAFKENFNIYIPQDAVAPFGDANQEEALDYLKTIYGAQITSTAAIIQ